MTEQIARLAIARKREADALSLRLAGATFDDIARQLGMASTSAARKCYLRALNRQTPAGDREEARRLEGARLDRLGVPYWQRALNGDLEAAEFLLRLSARRCRIMGLDAPIDLNVNALMRLIAEMRRLPDADLLQTLGYEDEQPALPEPTDDAG